MTWTHFRDAYSGASYCTEWHHIFIELPRDEAIEQFEEGFGFSPLKITCGCCGPDYDIREVDEANIVRIPTESDSVKIINEDRVNKIFQ